MAGLLNTTTTQTGSPTRANPNDPATAILPGGVTPATPAPTPTSSITQNAKGQTVQTQTPTPAPAPAPAPTSTSTSTSMTMPSILTQPADYSKPESQAEIDAYNSLALQAGKSGNYAALDSIGQNDERNIFGATWQPGYLANPEYIGASLSGKSTAGMQQWLPPGSASSAPVPSPSPAPAAGNAPITQMQVRKDATTGTALATPAAISADFAADFGRPPAAAGMAAYTALLQSHPNMTLDQLNAAIEAGAQTQDKSAMASLNGNGSTGANWTAPGLNPADVASNATTWNPATNQWQAATTPPTPAPGPLPPSVTGSPFVPASQGYAAAQDVVAPNQTVAGNFANVTDPNSVLMQQAAGNANQQSNARGLLNSSIGISAADSAMYTAALPIAQQDASTNATASLSNQQATNNASAFTSGAANTASIAGAQNATSIQNTNTNAATSVAVANLNAATTKYTANLSSQTQLQVQNLVNTNQQLLQSSTSAQNAYTAFTNQLSTITASTTMDQTAKDTAAANATTDFQNILATISATTAAGTAGTGTSNLNLTQYFPTLNTVPPKGQSNQGNGTPPPGEVVVPTGSTVGSTVLVNGIPYLVGQDGFGTTIKGV